MLVKEMNDLASHGVQMMTNVNVAHPRSPLFRKLTPVAISDAMSKTIMREEKKTAVPKLRKCCRLSLESARSDFDLEPDWKDTNSN